MNGLDLEVRPHDRPRFRRIGDEYRINDATFEQKLVTITGRDGVDAQTLMFHGTLLLKETWKSAWRRQGAELANLAFKSLIVPLSVAIGAGFALLWL